MNTNVITIEIDKLIRIFNNEIIYFNREVFNKLNDTNAKIHKWRDIDILNNLEVGDYIECDDNMVVKCTKLRTYKDTVFVYTNVSLAQVRKYKDKLYFSKLLGGYTPLRNDRGMNAKYPISKEGVKKRVFASLISNGIHPYKAYRTAYRRKSTMSDDQLNHKVLSLITDKEVIKVINENKIELQDKIKEAFSDDRMVKELMDLLDRSRKGTDAHRENIKFVLALLNKLPDSMVNKKLKSVNEIPVTPYEEVPPPKEI